MDALSEIKQNIRRITGDDRVNRTLFTAKVVRTSGEVCDVDLDGLTLTDVRLRAVVNGANSKMLITPKTNSYVLVADLSGNLTRLVVVAFSEIDKIEIDTETEIVINGGTKGLVKIDELNERLKNLENAFNSHTHIVSTTGTAAAQTGTAAATTNTSTEFQSGYSGYEDTKVKH